MRNQPRRLRRLLIGHRPRHEQRARVGDGIVHPPDAAVLARAEMGERRENRAAVFLAVSVRLADMQKQIVPVRALVAPVVDDGVGRGEHALAVHNPHARAVAREVEELAGLRQPPDFARAQMALEDVQRERADPPHVYPRTQHGDGYGTPHFRRRVMYFEFAQSHIYMLSKNRRGRKPRTAQNGRDLRRIPKFAEIRGFRSRAIGFSAAIRAGLETRSAPPHG